MPCQYTRKHHCEGSIVKSLPESRLIKQDTALGTACKYDGECETLLEAEGGDVHRLSVSLGQPLTKLPHSNIRSVDRSDEVQSSAIPEH